MNSLARIMKATITIPDFSSISKRSIPLHKTAVCSTDGATPRDQHSHTIEQQGRIAWQRQTGYNLRSYIKLAIQRYKRIFGNAMKARALLQQKTEDSKIAALGFHDSRFRPTSQCLSAG